jgi:putative ATP-binding cassette transporter
VSQNAALPDRRMNKILAFYRAHGAVPIPRLVLMAAVSGIAGMLVLGTINMGATAAAHGGPVGQLLAVLLIAQVIYTLSQRYVFGVAFGEAERAMDAYRVKQVERVRRCDLDSLEAIGPALIYGALTRQTQMLYTSTASIVIGLQSAVVLACGLVYLGVINLAALVLAAAILGVGVAAYLVRMKRTRAELMGASQKENELFNSLTDLLEGFKEVRLNRRRSAELATFISAISGNVRDVRSGVNVKLMELFLFAQLTFYIACAALVFLLPPLGFMGSTELLKTVVAVLFLLGPVTGITGAVPAVANALVACAGLTDLEDKLKAAASDDALPAADAPQGFSEITLRSVVYRHGRPDEAAGFQIGPVDFTLRPRELVFISGANGSGKSTLLRLLTALYTPRQGTLLIDGRPVAPTNRESFQNLFATVFSDFHLFERSFGLGDVSPEKVREWLETTGLTDKTGLKDGRFDTIRLSTGQRKRLALVVAALEDRPIYVFDEFAADQDVEFRRKFYDEMLPALLARGKTVVAVTHDERYFDRATRHLTMEEGRLLQRRAGHDGDA